MSELTGNLRQAIEQRVGPIEKLEEVEICLTERPTFIHLVAGKPGGVHTFSLLLVYTSIGKVVVSQAEECDCFQPCTVDDQEFSEHKVACLKKLIEKLGGATQCPFFYWEGLPSQSQEGLPWEAEAMQCTFNFAGIKMINPSKYRGAENEPAQ